MVGATGRLSLSLSAPLPPLHADDSDWRVYCSFAGLRRWDCQPAEVGCQPAAILIHCCRAAVHLTCRYSGSAHDILAAVSNRIRRLEEAREQLRDDLGLHDIRKVRELITKYGSNWDKVVEKNEEMVQDLSAQLSQLSQREKELTKELML